MDNMFNLTGSIGGLQIIIAPEKRIQRKTHKKKRINKKWAKRYGYKHIKSMEDNTIYLIPGHNQILLLNTLSSFFYPIHIYDYLIFL